MFIKRLLKKKNRENKAFFNDLIRSSVLFAATNSVWTSHTLQYVCRITTRINCNDYITHDKKKISQNVIIILNLIEFQIQFQPKCSKLSQFYLTSSQALDISFQLVVWAINCWYNRRFLRGLSIKHWKIFFCWHIFSMVLTISKGNVGQYSLFKICISIFRKQCQIKEIFEQILSFQSFLIVLEVY